MTTRLAGDATRFLPFNRGHGTTLDRGIRRTPTRTPRSIESFGDLGVGKLANSADGGTLLIGVADHGTLHGLAGDYQPLHKDGKDDPDVF
jgi:hypothetical protein